MNNAINKKLNPIYSLQQFMPPVVPMKSLKENLEHYYGRRLPTLTEVPIVVHQIRPVSGRDTNQVMPLPVIHAKREIQTCARRPHTGKVKTTTYWYDRGWEKRGNYLIGHYASRGNRYPGSVEITGSIVTPAKYYIYDPPKKLLNGGHGPCFRFKEVTAGMDKYWIHFSEEPSDIDSGIIKIENTLTDSIGW